MCAVAGLWKKLVKPAMPKQITYDDKIVFITDYISKLPKTSQIELLEEAPSDLTMVQTVDFLYAKVAAIVARNNPGLRFNQPQPPVPDALRPAEPVEKSNRHPDLRSRGSADRT